MSHRALVIRVCASVMLVGLFAFGGCALSSGNSGTGGVGTPTAGKGGTPAPKTCASQATATALAFADGPNMAGNIPEPAGAPLPLPTTLSNFTYPLGIPDENTVGNAPSLTFSAFAPDAKHLAVAVQQNVPFTAEYDPYVVDTSTLVATRILLPSPIKIANSDRIPRLFAWADAHTLIVFANPALNGAPAGPTYSYNITTQALTPLAGAKGALEGVVRCRILFYSTLGAFSIISPSDPNHTQSAPLLLNRYDLSTNTDVGAPIKISEASTWAGAEGDVDYAGWDASQDGTRIAYQTEKVTVGPTIVSTWFAANADGTGASPILLKVTSNQGARMAISPDAAQVAVTEAMPAPDVISGPMSGGPATFYDTPLGFAQPGWLANSHGFFASSSTTTSPISVLLYVPCGAAHCTGTTVIAKASYPATLP
jgi:hypothetical protein